MWSKADWSHPIVRVQQRSQVELSRVAGIPKASREHAENMCENMSAGFPWRPKGRSPGVPRCPGYVDDPEPAAGAQHLQGQTPEPSGVT